MKSKAEMMKRLREERKALGLVEFRAYVTENKRAELQAVLDNKKINN